MSFTKEEMVEIKNRIEDINFDIYECRRELKALNRFLDSLQNKYVKTKEHIECIKTVKEEIAKKELYIKQLEKERAYYQEWYLYGKDDGNE